MGPINIFVFQSNFETHVICSKLPLDNFEIKFNSIKLILLCYNHLLCKFCWLWFFQYLFNIHWIWLKYWYCTQDRSIFASERQVHPRCQSLKLSYCLDIQKLQKVNQEWISDKLNPSSRSWIKYTSEWRLLSVVQKWAQGVLKWSMPLSLLKSERWKARNLWSD